MSKRQKPCPNIDFGVTDNGSTVSFLLYSDEAKAWVDTNVELEGWQWLGQCTFVVDHRFAAPLIEGMAEAGLVMG
jgi:hypothetical protein